MSFRPKSPWTREAVKVDFIRYKFPFRSSQCKVISFKSPAKGHIQTSKKAIYRHYIAPYAVIGGAWLDCQAISPRFKHRPCSADILIETVCSMRTPTAPLGPQVSGHFSQCEAWNSPRVRKRGPSETEMHCMTIFI